MGQDKSEKHYQNCKDTFITGFLSKRDCQSFLASCPDTALNQKELISEMPWVFHTAFFITPLLYFFICYSGSYRKRASWVPIGLTSFFFPTIECTLPLLHIHIHSRHYFYHFILVLFLISINHFSGKSTA